MKPKAASAPSPAYCNCETGHGPEKNIDKARNETAPAGTRTIKPRTILLSPNSRLPRNFIPKSSGIASRDEQDDFSQIVCRHPEGINAASKNAAQSRESGSFTS